MKTASLALLGSLCLVGGLRGQPHVSPVGAVGFTTITLEPGYNAVSVSLTNDSTFVGAVVETDGVTANVVTASGSNLNIGSLLHPAKAYYLEVIAGVAAGARFEIDVGATIASGDDTVTLVEVSPTNTASPVPDISGCAFTIREHVTVSQIFGGAGNVLLQGAATAAEADRVMFFDSAANSFVTYWLHLESGGEVVEWRSLVEADATDYSSLPIPPGAGVFVFRQPSSGATTLRHAGSLRTTPFRWRLPAGIFLSSHAAPVDHSPSAGDMTVSNGWKGAGGVGAADQVQVWNGAAFDTYWLRANASGSVQQWRRVSPADTTDYSSSLLLNGDQAILIRTQEADSQRVADESD